MTYISRPGVANVAAAGPIDLFAGVLDRVSSAVRTQAGALRREVTDRALTVVGPGAVRDLFATHLTFMSALFAALAASAACPALGLTTRDTGQGDPAAKREADIQRLVDSILGEEGQQHVRGFFWRFNQGPDTDGLGNTLEALKRLLDDEKGIAALKGGLKDVSFVDIERAVSVLFDLHEVALQRDLQTALGTPEWDDDAQALRVQKGCRNVPSAIDLDRLASPSQMASRPSLLGLLTVACLLDRLGHESAGDLLEWQLDDPSIRADLEIYKGSFALSPAARSQIEAVLRVAEEDAGRIEEGPATDSD